jgi:L-fuconolactonase
LIDAHQHIWQIGRNGHEWPTPDLAPIYQDFMAENWAMVAEPLGITGTVLVQSQPNEADTHWLLSVAEQSTAVLAVVGWTDLKAADAPDAIARLAGEPKLKGLRPMLQSLPEEWIDDTALDAAVEAMIVNRLTFDALVYTRHLPHLRAFAQRWPDLPIVIDHGAKPQIAEGALEPWWSEMEALAALPNVMCKLSGLLTEMAAGQSPQAAQPYVRHLCEMFGPERLMWGSDWPVLLLAGDYRDWFDMAGEMSAFDEVGLAHLFGGTAARFYGLERH